MNSRAGLLLLIAALTIRSAVAQPAEIVIIRHAEKPDDPNALHLSATGRQRAKALVAFFTKNPAVTRNGSPVALFATHPTKRGHGQRPIETLEPLAKELHLQIQTPFDSEEYAKLAARILHDRSYRGKTVVICWVHEHMPQLAAALGVKPEPPKWKEHVYDLAYVITYAAGKAELELVPEKVLPGDSKHSFKTGNASTCSQAARIFRQPRSAPVLGRSNSRTVRRIPFAASHRTFVRCCARGRAHSGSFAVLL